jgi:hypothetical protein
MAVGTLGEALDMGWRVTARCAWGKRDGMKSRRECMFTAGRDMPLVGLESRLKCPRCGSPRVTALFTPPANSAFDTLVRQNCRP